MSLRVHHLSCGTMCPFGGRLINDSGTWLTGRMVCHCLLIETGDGLVLVDTGLARCDLEHPARRLGHEFSLLARPRRDPAASALEQVRGLGFSPDDVRHVFPTHLDPDHAAGLVDFPRAQVHVLAAEHADAMQPKGFFGRRRYTQTLWAHEPSWVVHEVRDGETWRGLGCVGDLSGLPPGILMVPLPGHSRGHCGVAVESRDGWLLHAGDAYFHRREMSARPGCSPGLRLFQRIIQADRRARLETQARLRELALSGEVKVFSAHDPAELEAFG